MSLYLSELIKLQSIQKQLERSQKTSIEQIENFENFRGREIFQGFQKVNLNCENTVSKIEIREILNKLKNVRKAVVLECGSNIPDLALFKKELITILDKIQSIKSCTQLKIQELQSETNNLDEEIKVYREKLLYWKEPIKVDLKHAVVSKINSSSSLPKDVEAFMRFCKNSNGHENGWLISDHQLFLKLRRKYKEVDILAINFNKILPDVSLEDVKKHEDWFIKYLKMKEKHDDAIRQWQKMKNDAKSSFPSDNIEIKEKTAQCYEENDARWKLKEKIKNWKNEQECKRLIVKEIEDQNIEQANSEKNRSKKSQDEKRNLIQQWREEKLASYLKEKDIMEAKAHLERKIKISVANNMVKIYRKQDKKISKRENITHTDQIITKKKHKSSVQSCRDPQRIFRPTQQWLNKFLADEEYHSNKVNFIDTIPKLKTPSWRKST